MSVEMEYSLQELVSGKGYLPSAFAGKINIGTLNAVPDLKVKRIALFLNIIEKILSLVQIFLGILCNKKNGGNRRDDLKIIEHVLLELSAESDHADVIYKIVYHQLVDLDLLIDP